MIGQTAYIEFLPVVQLFKGKKLRTSAPEEGRGGGASPHRLG